MECLFCSGETRVTDKRESPEGTRRRRECLKCKKRFTTYEKAEKGNIIVVKKDGTRQLYDRAKLTSGMQKACEKTSITGEQLDGIVSSIEKALYDAADGEISSHHIGTIIMDTLANINQVAYVRFASVYRSFADIESFERELARIKQRLDRKK